MQGSIDFSGVLSGSVTGEGGGGAVPVVTANATVDANTGTPSCDVVRTGTDLNPNFTFNFKNIKGATGSAGSPGQNGTDGTDGVSPTVSIGDITNGHRVTITDATHPSGQVFDVMNGSNGQDGTNGTNGTNGVSPAVTITEITDGHRVTITDATHPSGQSFDVYDGEKGDTGQTGPQGQTGPVGPGVNPGGTTGQILYKASNADYDTLWGDIPSYSASTIIYDPTGRTYISDTDVQGALDEVDGALGTINASLTNYTDYIFNEVLIGKRQGYNLYRRRIDFSNIQSAIDTETLLGADVLPSGALNPTISDKSFIKMGNTEQIFSPNNRFFITYFIGRNAYFRQGFSSSQTWNLVLFVEYALQV